MLVIEFTYWNSVDEFCLRLSCEQKVQKYTSFSSSPSVGDKNTKISNFVEHECTTKHDQLGKIQTYL